MFLVSVEFKQYLERSFLDWQYEQGERKTLSEFAAYLGISKGVLNNYFSGRRNPSEENIELLAKKLGDEVYDVLGIPRPDDRLTAIIKAWGSATDELRTKIEQLFLEELQRSNAFDAKSDVAETKRKTKTKSLP